MQYCISHMCPENTIPLKTIIDRSLADVAKDGPLWRYHSWSVTSHEREVLVLWRYIRRLFLHVKIGKNAIFTGAKQLWISIFYHRYSRLSMQETLLTIRVLWLTWGRAI